MGGNVPCLHVRLTVLLGRRVVELKSAETGAGHEQEGDVLDVLDRLLVGVLQRSIVSRCKARRVGSTLTLKIFRISKLLTTVRKAPMSYTDVDPQEELLTEQRDGLGATLLHRGRDLSQHGVGRLARLVPRSAKEDVRIWIAL